MKLDWVVVGAGFTGATFARAAAERGQKVLVVDRRNHVGGNGYDEYDEAGILVHRYGPHIFHTENRQVWEFLSRFTEWRPYMHRVRALVDGHWVPLPFNLDAIERLFPRGLAEEVTEELTRVFGMGTKVPILKLREAGQAQLQFLAKYVYDRVFAEYTRKQWGVSPEELDPSVTARVPVLVSRDDRYFHDRYQAMPALGYAQLFRRMLDHPNIKLLLNASYAEISADVAGARLLYTGRIDEFFAFRFGPLPYRSLRFDFRTLRQDRFQEVGTQNYPSNDAFTRITELKHLTGQQVAGLTSICLEYPEAYAEGANEPYYPIPMPQNRALYERYVRLATEEAGHVVFAGRLGDYEYLNMDQAVARALGLAARCC